MEILQQRLAQMGVRPSPYMTPNRTPTSPWLNTAPGFRGIGSNPSFPMGGFNMNNNMAFQPQQFGTGFTPQMPYGNPYHPPFNVGLQPHMSAPQMGMPGGM